MKTDIRSRISKHHILYVHAQYLRNPKSVRLPLPVSVFCFRVTDTTFGFVSGRDREIAAEELAAFATTRGYNLSVTTFRDVSAPIAAQIILWHQDGRPGGFSIHHGGKIKSCSLETRHVVTGKAVVNKVRSL
jgi:hypothetical protein